VCESAVRCQHQAAIPDDDSTGIESSACLRHLHQTLTDKLQRAMNAAVRIVSQTLGNLTQHL